MKKYFRILMAVLLCVSILTPISTSATSKTYYYSVDGTSKVKPGIYKGTINGKGTAVLKESVYKSVYLEKSPISVNGPYVFTKKGAVAKSSDYKNPYSLITNPIQNVQQNGKDLYFTKFLYETAYMGSMCGGGSTHILEIYKRNSNGKVTKVVSDKVTSNTNQSYYVKDKYIYYAKLNKDPLGEYNIVRSTLDGKTKTTLKKNVDDFWINGKYIFYVYKNALYKMDLNGKNSKKYSNLKVELYNMNGCTPGNYNVIVSGENYPGLIVEDYEKDQVIYLDFSTGKTTKLSIKFIEGIYALDVKKQRNINIVRDEKASKYTMGLFDFKGKLIKKAKATLNFEYWDGHILSADASKGEVIYIDGSNLKKIKF